MSEQTLNAGSRFKGTNTGNVSFGGTNFVETVDGQIAYAGSEFDGEQRGDLKFNENNRVVKLTRENVDHPTESFKSSTSQSGVSKPQPQIAIVEPLQVIPRIGSTVVVATAEIGFQIKGHATIFNQEFKNTQHFRDGSANDVEYLKTTFERLGLETMVKADLKHRDIVKAIDSLSKTDFSFCKLFVCVFMSHGHSNGIVCAADKEFKLKPTLIDPIMENSSLNGIPKIFITVACRGSANYEECDVEEFDGHILSTANGIDYSNCIISYSTYEGHVSKRTRTGTYFIQYLCDNINGDNGDTKIHSIFAEVNGKLAEMYKQVPVFESTMGNICFKDLASTPNQA